MKVEHAQARNNIGKDNWVVLKKCIYGLASAMKKYYKKAVKIVKRSVFNGGNVDPSPNMKKCDKNQKYVALFVYENLMMRNPEAIYEAIKAQKHGLISKIVEDLQDYLSCEVKFFKDKKRA